MSNFNAVNPRNTDKAPKCPVSSQTVAFSHYNNFSAQLPIDPKTGKLVEGDVKRQTEQCFQNIEAVLASIGHVMNDVARISFFLTNVKELEIVQEVYKSHFQTYLPTLTVVVVAALPLGAKVQVDILITNGEGSIPNAPQAGDLIKLSNNTLNAPQSLLSTQTVSFSHYNNLSAQLPIDPKLGRLVEGGITEQARQCFRNVKAILTSIDVPFDDIVKVTIFVKKLSDMDAVNAVYTCFFPDSSIARSVAYMPARTVVQVADLPLGALIQVETVIAHGDGTPPQIIEDRHGIVIKANNTDKAPTCPFSTQTVAFSHYNHISAQLPIDAKTNALILGGIKEQTEQCLKHLKAIVTSINHKLEDVVKVNIYLKNITDLDTVNDVYKAYFPSGVPARRVVGVSELPKEALIQMDAVISNAEGTAR